MIFAYGILTTVEEVEEVFETELDDAFVHIEEAGYSYARNGNIIFIYDSVFAEEYDDFEDKQVYHKFDPDVFDYEENYKNLVEYMEMFDKDIELVTFQRDDENDEDIENCLDSLNTIDKMLEETELSDSDSDKDEEKNEENQDDDNPNDK